MMIIYNNYSFQKTNISVTFRHKRLPGTLLKNFYCFFLFFSSCFVLYTVFQKEEKPLIQVSVKLLNFIQIFLSCSQALCVWNCKFGFPCFSSASHKALSSVQYNLALYVRSQSTFFVCTMWYFNLRREHSSFYSNKTIEEVAHRLADVLAVVTCWLSRLYSLLNLPKTSLNAAVQT